MKFFVTMMGILIFAIQADAGVSINNPFYCYALDSIRSSITMHSTGTSYEAIRRFNFTTFNPNITSCTPSRFWYIGQYGNRTPYPPAMQTMLNFAESSTQTDILRNYDSGRTTLCRQDFEAIRDWIRDPDFTIENGDLTTEAGRVAMHNIARRFQQHFPHILTETYSPQHFHFRHAGTERTNTSIRAFAAGLFGVTESQNVIYEEVPEVDWFLRPSVFCPAYDEFAGWTEREGFERGPEIEQMLEEVNRKLGFHSSNQLSYESIFVMWQWCRIQTMMTFEISNSEIGDDSPWCAPFSVAHHALLEYAESLSSFYSWGYGFRDQRFLENLNCGLLQDLVNHMRSDDNTDQMARIFVSSVGEVRVMLVALGGLRDVWPLHRHNFAQQSARHWRTSLISPMAGNLVVVRHDCDGNDHDLIFLLNERPLLLPGCDQLTGVCKLSVIVNRLQRFIGADCATLFCSSH